MKEKPDRSKSKPNGAAAPAHAPEGAPTVEREIGPRLTIPVTKDGRIDWASMRPGRPEKLRKLLAEELGVPVNGAGSAPAPDASPLVNAQLCGMLFDVVAQVESLVAARTFGCTAEQAFASLRFSDAEKLSLGEPAARVLAKYLPSSLLDKYADECTLLLMLTMLTRQKIEALRLSLAKNAGKSGAAHSAEPSQEGIA